MLQAYDCDPMTRADVRLQAASAIQELCALYRVPRASMVPKELVEFHELCARLDALTTVGHSNDTANASANDVTCRS